MSRGRQWAAQQVALRDVAAQGSGADGREPGAIGLTRRGDEPPGDVRPPIGSSSTGALHLASCRADEVPVTLFASPAGPRHLALEADDAVRVAATPGRGRHAAPDDDRAEYDPRVDGDLLDWLGFAPAAG